MQGLMNSAGVTKFLLGVLTEIEDGALFLEDTTGECCDPQAQRRFPPLAPTAASPPWRDAAQVVAAGTRGRMEPLLDVAAASL